MTYYQSKPKTVAKQHVIEANLLGHDLTFTSASSTFSIKHIDPATKLLIESAQIQEEAQILDLGCGYGAVGIAIKKHHPKTHVTLTDINQRATSLTKKNAAANNVQVTIKKGDICTHIKETFDIILTNPPYVAGREVCYAFIEQAFQRLNQNGSLQLVARHTKGGKMLEKKMQETFGNVQTLAKKSGFRVYMSVKE